MRLWHQSLIKELPRQQLLGQHRECCALRGRGWGKKHSVVNYVFEHSPAKLVAYHNLVMNEMICRGYHPDIIWYNPDYRGTTLGNEDSWCDFETASKLLELAASGLMIYSEHDENYLQECIDNLKNKGIEINLGE